MKIGFDARMVKHAGIGSYISCLLPELIKQGEEHKFVLFGDPEKLSAISGLGNANIRRWTAPIYSPWEQFFVLYRPMDIDILHVPHFNIPLFFKKKLVVTLHDLIYLLFPESVPSSMAKAYASRMINACVDKAAGIISVSEHTRQDIIKLYGEDCKEKINVVHEAANRAMHRILDKSRIADIKCRYRLEDDVILYVGSVKPHKNVVTLIRAFALLKEWGLPHQLVICGRWDKKEDHLKKKLSDRHIRYLGEVPSSDLAVLYSMADVLVHLSLYEGFGLTVLEAMQCGTPVVVSNTSSLPEVVGKAALVVSPLNVGQIADTVYNVIVNKQLRYGMIESGYIRSGEFSWQKAARETLDVYEKAVK